MKSKLEKKFDIKWRMMGGPPLESEYRIGERRYRYDFAHVPSRTLIEIQGGIYGRNRLGHTSVSGIRRDCEKARYAAMLGWRLYPFTEDQITIPELKTLIDSLKTKIYEQT